MTEPLNVAIAGLGTVGGGTLEVLLKNKELLANRCGRPIEVRAIADPRKDLTFDVPVDGIDWLDDALALVDRTDIDVVVELIGGAHGIAKTLAEKALAAGRHVVTANKAMIAHHGIELAKAAESSGACLGYEAAVAGGIPIIKAMREGLAANGISRVYGILNGTCNYILTAMGETGRDFDSVLTEAQELGYAEADPSFDVDGVDTAHKLAILTSLAFGVKLDFGAVHMEGIRHVSALDIAFAEQLGYRIKLLGIAQKTARGIEQRVHPCMVPADSGIAKVSGVFNAVVADADFVDTTTYEGRGAGAHPTASAVVADIVDIARGNTLPTFTLPVAQLSPLEPAPMAGHYGPYYVRLMVTDEPGVFADVAAVLRDNKISMESVLQQARAPGEPVPVVMTVHETEEAAMVAALMAIEAMPSVVEPPRMIRIEPL
ncbi:MAG: homoserine dehydrogenase [Magnetospiraceae bacterium]